MAEHAARGDQEIEPHIVDDRLPARDLREQIADGSLLLHALERGGELLVLHIRQPKRLASNRLLKHQRLR